MARPDLWVFAGPNGAGKSTLVDCMIGGRLPVVNSDDIARDRLPRRTDGGLAELEAGKLALGERADRLRARESFGFETTLSGQSELRATRATSDAGYWVNLVFVGLPNAHTSAARVSERVRVGGHEMSTDDTDRRYPKIMANLAAALSIAERAILVDNSGTRHRVVQVRENGHSRIVGAMPVWARDALTEEPQGNDTPERGSMGTRSGHDTT